MVKRERLSQAAKDEFATMSDSDRKLLVKVQAKLRGWVLRNRNKKKMLEEARQAGGAYSVFELPTADKLVRAQIPHCGKSNPGAHAPCSSPGRL
jgi:hypothetical protein